ncbi:MAG: hypothetical protein ABSC17_09765 [Thermacetogeniaceae bacterium]
MAERVIAILTPEENLIVAQAVAIEYAAKVHLKNMRDVKDRVWQQIEDKYHLDPQIEYFVDTTGEVSFKTDQEFFADFVIRLQRKIF